MATSWAAVASSVARRLAEAAVTDLRASSAPSIAVALAAASPTLVPAARATPRVGCYGVVFPAASSASGARGSSPTPPSAVYIVTCAPPPTIFAAGTSPAAASSAFGPPTQSSAAASTSSTVFASGSTSLTPTAATIWFDSSSPRALIGSGAGGARKSDLTKRSPPINSNTRNFLCNHINRLPSPMRIDRRCYSNKAWTPWETPLSAQRSCTMLNSVRHYAWAWTPWNPTRPKGPEELGEFLQRLNEVDWTPEEEEKLKTAFLKKFFSESSGPKPVDMKFELIMIKLDDLQKITEARNRKMSEWDTIRIWGRKFDFSKLRAAIGLFFRP